MADAEENEKGVGRIREAIDAIANGISNAYDNFKSLLRETPVEVFVCAALGAALMGYGFHKMEENRARKIPLGFSEISQLEVDLRNGGREVGEVTRYLTSVNDSVMKIFECWNESNRIAGDDNTRRFASELRKVIDPDYRVHHYNLNDFLTALPGQSNAVLRKLNYLKDAETRAAYVNSQFLGSWNDSHDDEYHTEIYWETETSTDSDGNTTTDLVMKTRQVYDYTDHSYQYNRAEGEEASRSVDELLNIHSSLGINEELRTASKINQGGEKAARESRAKKEQERLTSQDLKAIADNWYNGSTLRARLPAASEALGRLRNDAYQWRGAKNTARSTSYRTYSHLDSGPVEFRIAESAVKSSHDLSSSLDNILEGVEYVNSTVPELDAKIRNFICITLNKEEGNTAKLKTEIMDTAKKWYNLNFEKGFDVNRYRSGIVALGVFLGLVAGGAAGVGVNSLGDRFIWKKRDEGY